MITAQCEAKGQVTLPFGSTLACLLLIHQQPCSGNLEHLDGVQRMTIRSEQVHFRWPSSLSKQVAEGLLEFGISQLIMVASDHSC